MSTKGYEIWKEGHYHLFLVPAGSSPPWRSLCGEQEARTLETKTPGACTCIRCLDLALQLASVAVDNEDISLDEIIELHYKDKEPS